MSKGLVGDINDLVELRRRVDYFLDLATMRTGESLPFKDAWSGPDVIACHHIDTEGEIGRALESAILRLAELVPYREDRYGVARDPMPHEKEDE